MVLEPSDCTSLPLGTIQTYADFILTARKNFRVSLRLVRIDPHVPNDSEAQSQFNKFRLLPFRSPLLRE